MCYGLFLIDSIPQVMYYPATSKQEKKLWLSLQASHLTLFSDKCQKMLQIDTYLCIQAVLLCTFFVKFFKLKHDLQRNSRHDLKNEWNSVLSTVPESLAFALIHLSASRSPAGYLHSQNSIFFYFSSLSMVAILVCESHRQVRSSRTKLSENWAFTFPNFGPPQFQ